MQQGRHVGRSIARRVAGQAQPQPFHYFDKGNMAVIGRNFAILESGRWQLSGFVAWVAWAAIHIMFLPQAGSKVMVFTQWWWTYVTKQRGSRLILEPRVAPAKL
jgi:NADH dehydrogenase